MPPELTDTAAEDALEQGLPAVAAEEDEASAEGGEEGAEKPDGEDGDGQEAAEGASEESDSEGLKLNLDEDLAGDDAQNRAPNWLRDLRKENRAKDRRIRELELEIARGRAESPEASIGAEPNPDDYEMWEEAGKAKFRTDYAAWISKKTQLEAQQRRQQEDRDDQDRKFLERKEKVARVGATLAGDYEERIQVVKDTLDDVQFGLLVGEAGDPKIAAQMLYLLSHENNYETLNRLASIKNPIRYHREIVLMEAGMKSQIRTKSAPPPDRQIRSSVSGAAVVDNQLSRLREEARNTGDYSKLMDFQRAQAAKAKAAK